MVQRLLGLGTVIHLTGSEAVEMRVVSKQLSEWGKSNNSDFVSVSIGLKPLKCTGQNAPYHCITLSRFQTRV